MGACLTSGPTPSYDAVLPCKLSYLCGEDGEWKVTLHREALAMPELSGLTIGILGHYNRGKTWIMSQLAKCTLPSQRTEGLSFKWISEAAQADCDAYYHIVIDTAGLNSPIRFIDKTGKDEKKSNVYKACQETDLYEAFVSSMTLQLSDFIFIVVNELTCQDHLFLHSIAAKWSGLCKESTAKFKEVFVIHNFRFTETAEEREKLFYKSTADVYEGSIVVRGRNQAINIFYREDHHIRIRHVCLMQDRGAGKKYNKEVFSLLRDWIKKMIFPEKGPKCPRQFAEVIGNSATALLRKRGFLHNVKQIKTDVNTESNALLFRPIKQADDQPITIATSQADLFYGNVQEFNPMALVTTYRTKKEQPCRLVLLELPGSLNNICVTREIHHPQTRPGHVVVQVKGTKEEPRLFDILNKKLNDDEDAFLPADRTACEASKVVHSDACVYGTFSQIFHIPLQFVTPPKMIRDKNGTVILLFRSEDDSSSTASD